MLKGIVHIDMNTNLSGSKKKKFNSSYLNNSIDTYKEQDSLMLSEGVKALNRYNLSIKKFKKKENGLLELSFSLSDIEFSTAINLEDLSNYINLRYDLQNTDPGSKITSTLFTKTILEENPDTELSVSSIKYFLERVSSLDITSELNVTNTRALSNLLDNIYSKVLSEFKGLNSVLIFSISKIMNISISNHPVSELGNELILVEKIKPKNEKR